MESAKLMAIVRAVKVNGLAEIVQFLYALTCALEKVNAVKVHVNVTKDTLVKIVLPSTHNTNALKHVTNVVHAWIKNANVKLDLKAKHVNLSSVLLNVVSMADVLEMELVHRFAYVKPGTLVLHA